MKIKETEEQEYQRHLKESDAKAKEDEARKKDEAYHAERQKVMDQLIAAHPISQVT